MDLIEIVEKSDKFCIERVTELVSAFNWLAGGDKYNFANALYAAAPLTNIAFCSMKDFSFSGLKETLVDYKISSASFVSAWSAIYAMRAYRQKIDEKSESESEANAMDAELNRKGAKIIGYIGVLGALSMMAVLPTTIINYEVSLPIFIQSIGNLALSLPKNPKKRKNVIKR
jgi:hypothetical protein